MIDDILLHAIQTVVQRAPRIGIFMRPHVATTSAVRFAEDQIVEVLPEKKPDCNGHYVRL